MWRPRFFFCMVRLSWESRNSRPVLRKGAKRQSPAQLVTEGEPVATTSYYPGNSSIERNESHRAASIPFELNVSTYQLLLFANISQTSFIIQTCWKSNWQRTAKTPPMECDRSTSAERTPPPLTKKNVEKHTKTAQGKPKLSKNASTTKKYATSNKCSGKPSRPRIAPLIAKNPAHSARPHIRTNCAPVRDK